MEGPDRVADVRGMQHCLDQQHPVLLLLQQEWPWSDTETTSAHEAVKVGSMVEDKSCDLTDKSYESNVLKKRQRSAFAQVALPEALFL